MSEWVTRLGRLINGWWNRHSHALKLLTYPLLPLQHQEYQSQGANVYGTGEGVFQIRKNHRQSRQRPAGVVFNITPLMSCIQMTEVVAQVPNTDGLQEYELSSEMQ